MQVVAQATHAPLAQKVFGAQLWAGPHTGQLLASVPQVSTPLPLQRTVPEAQEVPQVPQAPPEQNVLQVWPVLHEVQPRASATHTSTLRPAQRVAPAVQVLLHEAQLPLVQTLPEGHVRCVHWVHPVRTFHWHSSMPVAVQRLAPVLHAWQEVQTALPHTSP